MWLMCVGGGLYPLASKGDFSKREISARRERATVSYLLQLLQCVVGQSWEYVFVHGSGEGLIFARVTKWIPGK